MNLSHTMSRSAGSQNQRGVTLVELMLAMVIGLFLMLGTLTVFQQSRASFRVSDSVARLQENGRFVLDMMEPDIRVAKLWGRSADPGLIDNVLPGGLTITCDTVDSSAAMVPPTTYTAWALDINREVWAVDEGSGYGHAALGVPCSPNGGARVQSDVLVIRRASTQPIVPTAGVIQVHTDLTRGEFFNDGAAPVGYAAAAQTHNVLTNVYYVSQRSDLDPNTPSLRIKTLMPGGVHQDQEIMPGVENLQVQLGVDTDGDLEIERYVDADHDIVNPTTGGTIPDAQILAVRLWIVMRSESVEVGFTDNAQYLSPDPDVVVTPCAGGGCGYPDNFRRLAISTTVALRNNR
jgi:type IV pilus assembly protein PilW